MCRISGIYLFGLRIFPTVGVASRSLESIVVFDDLTTYLDDVRRHAALSVEEEQVLARAYRDHGDTRAAHALVTASLRFVVRVASGYRGYRLRLPDLIQEGNLGLLKAVTKFDPDQGIRLITYASWWIRAHIQAHILQSWSVVKMGTTQAQRRLFFSLARTRRELARSGPDEDLDDRGAPVDRMAATDDLQDLGARLGFSRERARQLEIRARGKLRAALAPLAANG